MISISSDRVLVADKIIPANIVIEHGTIASIDSYAPESATFDASGKFITPGFVDLHCDALEKEIEPRPHASFESLFALKQMDKRLAMAGVTTMYHAIGFEDNIAKNRSVESAISQLEIIKTANDSLLVDNKIHARFEISMSEAIAPIQEAITNNYVDLLSLMDHSPGQGQFKSLESFKKFYGAYYGLDDTGIAAVIEKKQNKDEDKINVLIAFAREHNITLLSHDDDSTIKLDSLLKMGVRISEFPLTVEVAEYAKQNGITTGMGAPNIVRGGSQSGNIAAIDLVKRDLCGYLCSDYHPASLLQSMYTIEQSIDTDLAHIFPMITSTPATYAGLTDRGSIATGKLADLVVIDDASLYPQVMMTIKEGKVVYTYHNILS